LQPRQWPSLLQSLQHTRRSQPLRVRILVCHHCNLYVLATTLNNLEIMDGQSVPLNTVEGLI